MPVRIDRPGSTFAGHSTLESLTCCECGVLFAIPEHMMKEARRRGSFEIMVHCPNGHSQGWGESTEEKKRKEAERRAEREAARAARLLAERDQLDKEVSVQKGRATRFKNERDKDRRRVAHGVCPCCQRTFKQLAAHMKSQHPDYVQEHSQ